MPSGLISISPTSAGARRMSATSFGNGSALRPWKERVQSIFSSAGVSSSRGLSERPVLEMLEVVGCEGVTLVARSDAAGEVVVDVSVGDDEGTYTTGFLAGTDEPPACCFCCWNADWLIPRLFWYCAILQPLLKKGRVLELEMIIDAFLVELNVPSARRGLYNLKEDMVCGCLRRLI